MDDVDGAATAPYGAACSSFLLLVLVSLIGHYHWGPQAVLGDDVR